MAALRAGNAAIAIGSACATWWSRNATKPVVWGLCEYMLVRSFTVWLLPFTLLYLLPEWAGHLVTMLVNDAGYR